MPFIACLGYNVFDPTEVVPEFTADVGTKKGEKVDYCIRRDGAPAILIEVKHHDVVLADQHMSQLYRYFSVTKARFGVLTNGLEYRFYTDLEAPNTMDSKPFLQFSMLELKDSDIEALKHFAKDKFSVDDLVTTAGELKYTNGIKKVLAEEATSPSEEIVRYLTKQVYAGNVTKVVLEKFTDIVKRAFQLMIHERIQDRLQSAIEREELAVPGTSTDSLPPGVVARDGDVVTTQEEMDAYLIVRAIMAEVVSPERIAMRDTKSYCGVLLDDNNRKPICRLRFNTAQKYL